MQLEVAPAVVVTLRVGGPRHVADAERSEQLAAREGQGIGACRPGEDSGQDVAVGATIGEARSRLSHHRQIERELQPVGAAAHLQKPRLLRLEATVPPRLHGEKVFERQPALAFVELRHRAASEEAQHRLVQVAQMALFDRQSDKRRCDALGDRCHVVPHPGTVRIKIRVQHQLSVAYDLRAMHRDVMLPNVVEHLDERR